MHGTFNGEEMMQRLDAAARAVPSKPSVLQTASACRHHACHHEEMLHTRTIISCAVEQYNQRASQMAAQQWLNAWCARCGQVSNVVLKTPQRKFEDTSAEAPPAPGKPRGTSTRSGAPPCGGLPAADKPRLRAAQPGGPVAGSKLRTFGP